jgi:hypothetical protein
VPDARAFSVVNTSVVSLVIAPTERSSFSAIWRSWCASCMPYYVVQVVLRDATDAAAQVLAIVVVPSSLLAAYYFRAGARYLDRLTRLLPKMTRRSS